MENRKPVKTIIVLLIFLITTLAFTSCCHGNQWVYFHDEEIKGYVVEAENGKPIEGAIVIGIWALVQVPGEGFGGYAKILETITDCEGKFVIPSWKTFEPWKFNTVVHELAPEIIIFKPGFKLYHSHKVQREGFLYDYSKTSEEKKKIKDAASLTPTKLKRIYTDEERAKNLELVETEGRLFDLIENLSKKEKTILIKAIKEEYVLLSKNRKERFRYIEQIEEHLPGDKK